MQEEQPLSALLAVSQHLEAGRYREFWQAVDACSDILASGEDTIPSKTGHIHLQQPPAARLQAWPCTLWMCCLFVCQRSVPVARHACLGWSIIMLHLAESLHSSMSFASMYRIQAAAQMVPDTCLVTAFTACCALKMQAAAQMLPDLCLVTAFHCMHSRLSCNLVICQISLCLALAPLNLR